MRCCKYSPRDGLTLIELLTVVAILGLLMALLLPALQAAREGARRTLCASHLRQLGVATHHYALARGRLPPPKLGTQFENRGSTLVVLLPFLDEAQAFEQYDSRQPVTAPGNREITSQPVAVFLCPSMQLPRAVPEPACGETLAPASYVISSRTSYAKYTALDGAFAVPAANGSYHLDFKHIRDGTSKTFLFGEIDYGHKGFLWSGCPALNGQPRWGDTTWADGYWYYAWGHVSAEFPQLYNANDKYLNPYSARAFRSDHPGGVNFVMVDASVRFIVDQTSPQVRSALVTRDGRESLPAEF